MHKSSLNNALFTATYPLNIFQISSINFGSLIYKKSHHIIWLFETLLRWKVEQVNRTALLSEGKEISNTDLSQNTPRTRKLLFTAESKQRNNCSCGVSNHEYQLGLFECRLSNMIQHLKLIHTLYLNLDCMMLLK